MNFGQFGLSSTQQKDVVANRTHLTGNKLGVAIAGFSDSLVGSAHPVVDLEKGFTVVTDFLRSIKDYASLALNSTRNNTAKASISPALNFGPKGPSA